MTSKHTPGPWWIDDENSVGADDSLIAIVKPTCDEGGRIYDLTWNANALLIASAPTLLAQRDELVETARGVLLVLSLLTEEVSRMGCHAPLAVEKFRAAVERAMS